MASRNIGQAKMLELLSCEIETFPGRAVEIASDRINCFKNSFSTSGLCFYFKIVGYHSTFVYHSL